MNMRLQKVVEELPSSTLSDVRQSSLFNRHPQFTDLALSTLFDSIGKPRPVVGLHYVSNHYAQSSSLNDHFVVYGTNESCNGDCADFTVASYTAQFASTILQRQPSYLFRLSTSEKIACGLSLSDALNIIMPKAHYSPQTIGCVQTYDLSIGCFPERFSVGILFGAFSGTGRAAVIKEVDDTYSAIKIQSVERKPSMLSLPPSNDTYSE